MVMVHAETCSQVDLNTLGEFLDLSWPDYERLKRAAASSSSHSHPRHLDEHESEGQCRDRHEGDMAPRYSGSLLKELLTTSEREALRRSDRETAEAEVDYEGRGHLMHSFGVEHRWGDLAAAANLFSFSHESGGGGNGGASSSSQPAFPSAGYPSSPYMMAGDVQNPSAYHPHSSLGNAGVVSHVGSAVASSLNLTNSTASSSAGDSVGGESGGGGDEPGGGGGGGSHPPGTGTLIYYQAPVGSGEMQQQQQTTADGFLTSILDEDFQLMDVSAVSDGMYHVRGGMEGGERVEVSNMGNGEGDWNQAGASPHSDPSPYATIPDYTNGSKFRGYGYAYRGLMLPHGDSERRGSGPSSATAPQKKHHMYGRRYHQEQPPPPPNDVCVVARSFDDDGDERFLAGAFSELGQQWLVSWLFVLGHHYGSIENKGQWGGQLQGELLADFRRNAIWSESRKPLKFLKELKNFVGCYLERRARRQERWEATSIQGIGDCTRSREMAVDSFSDHGRIYGGDGRNRTEDG
ncbi:unnamed protein product [Darwinula stevensoni]|uniref:Uncharacterized protein n=1 Tax=Darwinula stevensoni TaxID=69355 RepID=A0A7R9A3M5_9CRUS|nr:unnamed protein product [Darwinula stevensoni]CAG0891902.1 unnamed protein product [Darwinula stevensoni]